jgi:hypothetical protein
LEAKLQEQIPGEELVQVDGLYFYAKEIYVDDFALSSGRLEKSYALIPGAAIGGYLGAQSGAAGGAAGGATPAWSTWYYHFNDLGTVLATTDSGGDAIGVYEPDFFGNYTQTVVAEGDGGEGGEGGGEGGFQALTVPETPAPRPDTLGLQSKFFDPWAGLYDFGLRWLDPERGRWMSEEPLGLDARLTATKFCESMKWQRSRL